MNEFQRNQQRRKDDRIGILFMTIVCVAFWSFVLITIDQYL